jgi:hypothetical protein
MTGDDRYMEAYWSGVQYYKNHLFEIDGAPRWMHDKKYPFDIHGAAQGIITFTKAARHRKVYRRDVHNTVSWALRNLYRPKTEDFAYRQGRYMKWNYSLMRWCNAWMMRALSEFCRFSKNQNEIPEDDENQKSS